MNNFGFSWEYVAFCSGQVPWDSLGGGAMQGKNKRLLSLLDNNGAKTEPSIYVDGKPGHAIFLGGKNVYPNSFKAQFAYKKGYGITDIQGFKVYIDAGHGWNSSNNDSYDGGAEGCGYQEASLTQELAVSLTFTPTMLSGARAIFRIALLAAWQTPLAAVIGELATCSLPCVAATFLLPWLKSVLLMTPAI